MGIDLQLLQDNKGGDIAGVIASQKKRGAPEALVEDVLNQYKEWVKSESTPLALACAPWLAAVESSYRERAAAAFQEQQLKKQVNALQKEIGQKMKVKPLASRGLEACATTAN